jgi:hypothetical protein
MSIEKMYVLQNPTDISHYNKKIKSMKRYYFDFSATYIILKTVNFITLSQSLPKPTNIINFWLDNMPLLSIIQERALLSTKYYS